APPVTEADELVPVARDALAHDGADDGVQAGTIASTREHSDAHAVLLAVPWAPGVRSHQHDPPQESDQRRFSRRATRARASPPARRWPDRRTTRRPRPSRRGGTRTPCTPPPTASGRRVRDRLRERPGPSTRRRLRPCERSARWRAAVGPRRAPPPVSRPGSTGRRPARPRGAPR